MRNMSEGITALSIIHSICTVADASIDGKPQSLSCADNICSTCPLKTRFRVGEGKRIADLTEEDAMAVLADLIDGFKEANK
jgi:hypothetical protein